MSMTSDQHDSMLPKVPIPQFASYDEEAAFWDTHDLSDYWDEFEPVADQDHISHGLLVPLAAAELEQVRMAAHERGLDPGALLRLWVIERLEQDGTGRESA